jgi:Holliday junction resolvase RusA-like endonuclease
VIWQSFRLPINPEPWAIGPVGISNKGGKMHPYIGPNPQLLNYQHAVREYLQKNYGPFIPVERKCQLHFYFWRRLDTYTTPTGRVSQGHEADTTNLQKGLEDALAGLLFKNDRQVKLLVSEIIEQDVETDPGIMIIFEAPYRPAHLIEIPQAELEQFARFRADANKVDLGNLL